MEFLRKCLRPYVHYEFKKEIIESIFFIIEYGENARDEGLSVMMDLIEDCPFEKLLILALDGIGNEVWKSKHPESYLRFIYNRIILENEEVRAAAISALGNIAAHNLSIRPLIQHILSKCLYDTCDEVRDRTNYFLSFFKKEDDLREAQKLKEAEGEEEVKKITIVEDMLKFQKPGFDINALETYLLVK